MKIKPKRYENRFIAPIRWFLRPNIPKENDFFRLDWFIYKVTTKNEIGNIYPTIVRSYNYYMSDDEYSVKYLRF